MARMISLRRRLTSPLIPSFPLLPSPQISSEPVRPAERDSGAQSWMEERPVHSRFSFILLNATPPPCTISQRRFFRRGNGTDPHADATVDDEAAIEMESPGSSIQTALQALDGAGNAGEGGIVLETGAHGIGWYTPVDGVVAFIDALQDVTGLPWWQTIIASTIAIRMALLPLTVLQLRKMDKISQLLPKLPPPIPMPGSGRSLRQQYSLFAQQRRAMGCPTFLWAFASFAVQAPCFISWMMAVRRMRLNHHPGFDCGGALWFSDLTQFVHGPLGAIFPISVAGMHFLNVQVLGYKGKFCPDIHTFHDIGFKFHRERSITNEEQVDPFALVADELGMLANRLRSMIVTEIPKLATAAEYFFKMGVEGKRFRPMVLLLMASSLTMAMPEMAIDSVREGLAKERRLRQQRIAEITEMIHVASLLHDDVLDDADTRRGIGSLNFVMGNKLAVLAGDFLLSRASVALASLKNTEVVELLSKVLEDLVTGEIMQITSSSEQCCSMEYYMRKTFYKTASLMANSCKAIALLGGQPTEVCMLAYDYGRHLGLAFQLVDDVLDFTGTTASLGKGSLSDIRQGIITAPLLFALEEFPQLKGVIDRKFKDPGDIDLALEFLGKSEGIRKTKQLAVEHAHHAASAIDSLPPSESENVRICRKALVDLTEKVITRTK